MLQFLTLIGTIKEAIFVTKISVKAIVTVSIFVSGLVATTVVLNPNSRIPNALTLLTQIQETANLDTIQATYTVQVSAGIISGPSGIYSYSGTYEGDGEITAGIDLSDLSEDDIQVSWNRITLHLPPPKFTNCVITNFQRTSRSVTLFVGANWNMLYRLATIDAYYSLTEQGLQNQLLEDAEQVAGDILVDILSNATNIREENITIIYAEENRGANSDSDCEPDFPAGWGKEDYNNAWLVLP